MLKITLDYNVLIYNEEGSTTLTAVEFQAIADILDRPDLHCAVTAVIRRDNEADHDDARRHRLARRIASFPLVGQAPFRLDVSRLGGPDGLVSEAGKSLASAIEAVLWSGGGLRNKRVSNRATDVDHLLLHAQAARDVFVTYDRRMLDRRDALAALGIQVARASEVVHQLDDG